MIATTTRTLICCLLAGGAAAQVSHNRVQLDNGGETVIWLNDPFVGSDPTRGDWTGDYFWKVLPADVLRTGDGVASLTGIEYYVFDQDWDLDDATLWAYALTEGVKSEDLGGGGSGFSPGNIEPWMADPSALLVPGIENAGLGNPLGAGQCPPGDSIAGWLITETFEDTDGALIPIKELIADGAHDYVYSAFFPDGQSATFGGANCGGGGNATFQYYVSTDTFEVPDGGENIPDVLGTGYSAYGGRHFGDPQGGGFHFPVANSFDRGAQLAFHFDRPTLNVVVDAGLDGHGPERGLASLHVPLGLDAAGLPAGTQCSLGWEIYSADALGKGDRLAMAAATFMQPLGTAVPFFGGSTLLLNSVDPVFLSSLLSWGFPAFQDEGSESVARSGLIPIQAEPAFLGTAIWMQGFELDLGSESLEDTQVWKLVLRPNVF